MRQSPASYLFFFNDTATTEIYTLSLHDALPILQSHSAGLLLRQSAAQRLLRQVIAQPAKGIQSDRCEHVEDEEVDRSEEHTSELQSRLHLVCRLLLEKKKNASQLYAVRR